MSKMLIIKQSDSVQVGERALAKMLPIDTRM